MPIFDYQLKIEFITRKNLTNSRKSNLISLNKGDNMAKKSFCPRCGSKNIKYEFIYEGSGTWKCYHCGYEGSVVLKDGNIEKNIRETKKMEKLSQKLLWRR